MAREREAESILRGLLSDLYRSMAADAHTQVEDRPFLIGGDGQFLGLVTDDKKDSFSVSNRYGPFGSPFSPVSVFNSSSVYGSSDGDLSLFNQDSLYPPKLMARGKNYGAATDIVSQAGVQQRGDQATVMAAAHALTLDRGMALALFASVLLSFMVFGYQEPLFALSNADFAEMSLWKRVLLGLLLTLSMFFTSWSLRFIYTLGRLKKRGTTRHSVERIILSLTKAVKD